MGATPDAAKEGREEGKLACVLFYAAHVSVRGDAHQLAMHDCRDQCDQDLRKRGVCPK